MSTAQMKKVLPRWIMSFVASLLLSSGLMAQEQVEVSVKVTRDGKLVQDTTYVFEDVSEARHALKMMQVMSGDDEHSRAMVFISEEGETTELKEIHEDSLVWTTEKVGDGDHVKVMKYKIKEGEESHGERVIIIESEDGGSFDILVDEDDEGRDVVKKMQVRVVVSEEVDHDHEEEVDHDHEEDVEVKVVRKKEKK